MNKNHFFSTCLTTLRAVAIGTFAICVSACSEKGSDEPENGSSPSPGESSPTSMAHADAGRAVEIIDAAISNYFSGSGMSMSRYYNPYTGKRSDELGSVWMYTSSIEAVNAAMRAMKALRDNGESSLYDAHFARYKDLLASLADNADYYSGTFTLTSYTGTNTWTVYGVDRGNAKGTALVDGIHNVYDDQMWLIREFIEAYRLTDDKSYLDKAEYLTAYVLDGWDCTLNQDGNQNGGITWGPGYVTKHSCSNGPVVSPLVWLSEIYKGKNDAITYGVINPDNSRGKATAKKTDYYLEMAKAVYAYQKEHLLIASSGVYNDMMGNDEHGGAVQYETVDGERYRAHSALHAQAGPAISYNSGTMLSGGIDLYKATGDRTYLSDVEALADNSFAEFAHLGETKPGLYTFDISGFRNWFNGVLLRGYIEASSDCPAAGKYAEAFQSNLDYAYDNYLHDHMLPTNLLVGWNRDNAKNNIEAMFTFSFAAQYAGLAQYQLTKN